MLETNDYKVFSAEDGEKALKVLSELQDPLDLILNDITMPVMDGYAFFKSVSEDPKWGQVPFVFLTTHSTPENIRLGKMRKIASKIAQFLFN